jgi:hypothetical protein
MRSLLLLCAFLTACGTGAGKTPSTAPEPTFLEPGSALLSPSAPTLDATAAEAREVMLQFFAALNASDYATGASLFGGSYETLQAWNPEVNPTDRQTLWQHGCERNGLQCLQVLQVVGEHQVSANVMKFSLQFRNTDGSLFVLGPCCGETETTMPPINTFECDVARTSSGEFKALCLPPYVP